MTPRPIDEESDEEELDVGTSVGLDAALSTDRARTTLEYVAAHDGVGVESLTIYVTRREAQRRGLSVTEVGFDEVRASLTSDVLPALEAANLVTVKPRTTWVEPARDAASLRQLLDRTPAAIDGG